jgi:putative DNA primase/helicase
LLRKRFIRSKPRIARVFALAALAGELASEWGITGWESGTAISGVIKIFEKWKEGQHGEAKAREYTQILSRIRDFIDRHGDSRFSDIDWTEPVPNKFNQGPPSVRDRAGYWKNTEYGKLYLFSPAGLQEAGGDFEMSRILKALKEAGAFVKTGADKKAITTRVPGGGTAGLYWIDPEKLQP